MVEIAPGTTGKAEFIKVECDYFAPWTTPNWVIDAGGGYVFDSSPGGWNADVNGNITVPIDAIPTQFGFAYCKGESCGPEKSMIYYYKFVIPERKITPPGPGDPICKL